MELMNEYLSSDNRVKPNFVVIKKFTISFTTSYESKSILLAYKEEKENSNGNLRKEEDAVDSTPPAENLRSGNCNAENYLSRTAKHCKVRRYAFKTIRIFIR